MRFGLYALGLLATSWAFVGVGCSDDSTSSGSSSSSSSSSASSASSASSSSGSGTGGMGGSGGASSSSSSSSGTGGYTFCGDCTSNTAGAYVKECKAQADACLADPDCATLATCSYDTCPTTAAGGCCTRACAMGVPQASQDLFYALDNCVFCTTCKDICAPEAGEYCAVTAPGGEAMCP